MLQYKQFEYVFLLLRTNFRIFKILTYTTHVRGSSTGNEHVIWMLQLVFAIIYKKYEKLVRHKNKYYVSCAQK
jgi:hypothetical protein